jgi:hypothetical protein
MATLEKWDTWEFFRPLFECLCHVTLVKGKMQTATSCVKLAGRQMAETLDGVTGLTSIACCSPIPMLAIAARFFDLVHHHLNKHT